MSLLPDERVVGDAVVHDPAKGRIDRNRTRNRWREREKLFEADNFKQLQWLLKDKVCEFDEKKKADSRLHSGRTFGLHEPSAWQYLTDNDDHDDTDNHIGDDR